MLSQEIKDKIKKNGRVTFSDRWVAFGSGTTHSGNSLKSPVDFIRTQGLIPKKLLPKEDWMKWEDYYDASKITQTLKDLGQEFLKRFSISYEQVNLNHFSDVLKDDMIGTAGYAWPIPVDGVYPAVPASDGFNHAFLLYKLPKYNVYDNYQEYNPQDGTLDIGGFTKVLAPDYVLFSYGYRVYVSSESTPSDAAIPGQVLNALTKYGLLSFFADWWKRFNDRIKGLLS